MSIPIKGIEVRELKIEVNKGEVKVSGIYHIVMTNGKTLAKQKFNEYDGVDIEFDKDTYQLLRDFSSAIDKSIARTLDLPVEEVKDS